MDAWTDCGANACIFAASRGGMRTNGGCMHLKGGPRELREVLRLAAATIVSQRRELEAARAVVERARTVHEQSNTADQCLWSWKDLASAINRYDDAAKAGKAVE